MNDKNIYLNIIYRDTLQHKSLKDIHKDLLKAIINPNKRLLLYNFNVAKRIKRLDKGPGKYYEGIGLTGLAIDIVNYLSVHSIFNNEYKLINSELMRIEDEEKHVVLIDTLNLTNIDKKVFFVASSHDDCAQDHLEAQGKIYIDQNWRNILDKNLHDKVREYIHKNNIATMQYIINAPTYFITRPNCRHYFVRYSVNDILTGNYTIPHRHIGCRDTLQTPRKANLEYYQDRLRLYHKWNKIYNTQDLDNRIIKTKILIKKWKK